MPITTYSELQTAISGFLNRSDLTSVIPDFISLAEADLNRRVRHWRMEARTTITIDARFEDLPSDWLETVRFHLTTGDTHAMEPASQAEMIRMRQARQDSAGRPAYYSLTGGQFEFFPTPDATYTGELVYLAKIPALSVGAPTNWLLTQAPDAYLYGSLVQANPYLKDSPEVWAAFYQNAVDGLNASSREATKSGAGLRMKIKGLS